LYREDLLKTVDSASERHTSTKCAISIDGEARLCVVKEPLVLKEGAPPWEARRHVVDFVLKVDGAGIGH
jgi:hypothetical protein